MTTLTLPTAKSTEQQGEVYTYERMLNELPESNLPCELWDGKIVLAPAPHFDHQNCASNLFVALHQFVAEEGFGKVLFAPFDMVLSSFQVVQPDILFVAKDRLSLIKDSLMGPADLVIEVTSPRSRRRDRIDKRDLYSQYGIKEYWIVDPQAKTVEVFSFDKLQLQIIQRAVPGEEAISRLLPGFIVNVDKVFAS